MGKLRLGLRHWLNVSQWNAMKCNEMQWNAMKWIRRESVAPAVGFCSLCGIIQCGFRRPLSAKMGHAHSVLVHDPLDSSGPHPTSAALEKVEKLVDKVEEVIWFLSLFFFINFVCLFFFGGGEEIFDVDVVDVVVVVVFIIIVFFSKRGQFEAVWLSACFDYRKRTVGCQESDIDWCCYSSSFCFANWPWRLDSLSQQKRKKIKCHS